MIVELAFKFSDETDAVALIAAIAGSVSAIAAVFGLPYIGSQVRQARKTSDLQTLQVFLKETKDYERALLEAKPERVGAAFTEFMNFLEVYAVSLDQKLVPVVSEGIIRKKLRDTLAILKKTPTVKPLLESAITSPETFEYVCKFMKKHGAEISQLAEALKEREADSKPIE